MKPVRMADIAGKLGVSIVTVSNGLAGRGGVSEEMRQKILETAEEMGYGNFGQTGGREKSLIGNTIGILCPDHFFGDNSLYVSLFRAIAQVCAKIGCSVLMELIPEQAERECLLPLLVADRKVDAILVMGETDGKYLAALQPFGLPCVLVGFSSADVPQLDAVRGDDIQSGYILTKHLLQGERRRIGFIGHITTAAAMDCCLGYTRALWEAGLSPRPEWRIDDGVEGQPLLLPEDMPDAFVCATGRGGFRLMNELQSRGRRVPADISVVSCDDSGYTRMCAPPLTAYRIDVESMAAAAVRRIQEKARGEDTWRGTSIIPGKLVLRKSSLLEDVPAMG